LLLRLASVYKVDLDELQGESAGNARQLREVFADPLLAGELPGDHELVEIADAAPNVASGILKLYRAYREQAARLTDLADLLAREGHATTLSGTLLPMDEVRDKLEGRPNYFDAIDDAAERFHAALAPGDDLAAALKSWLRKDHASSVRPLPVLTMPTQRRPLARPSMRLFLSGRLSPYDQLRELAMATVQLALQDEIFAELDRLAFSTAEAKR